MENLDDMFKAFDEVQQPRSEFEIRNFIVGSQDTEAKAYAHCVLEMSILYDNLRTAKLNVELVEAEIDELKNKKDKKSKIKAQIKEIELEQLHRARLGAMREFEIIFNIWKEFPVKYTRSQIEQDQPEYWDKRITRQANQDMLSSGRISPSNIDALRMIGKSAVPQLDVVRDVERRYLEGGKQKVLIAVATEEKAENGIPVLKDLTLPSQCEVKILNVWGRTIDDAYDYIVQQAIEDDADWIITIEDDTYPQKDAIIKLLKLAQENRKSIVGAWYPKRSHPRQGTSIIIKDGIRQFLDDIGGIHEVYTIPMGCTVFPTNIFLEIPRPFFVTTNNITQDSFFSQLAREHGYRLLVDTDIKCKHIDRNTKEVFE